MPRLDHWLTGRRRGRIAGRSCTVPAEHPPWSLWNATVVQFDESLPGANGLIRPSEPPLVRYFPGSEARLGIPERRVFPISAGG